MAIVGWFYPRSFPGASTFVSRQWSVVSGQWQGKAAKGADVAGDGVEYSGAIVLFDRKPETENRLKA
jgi:hypothetical protein